MQSQNKVIACHMLTSLKQEMEFCATCHPSDQRRSVILNLLVVKVSLMTSGELPSLPRCKINLPAAFENRMFHRISSNEQVKSFEIV